MNEEMKKVYEENKRKYLEELEAKMQASYKLLDNGFYEKQIGSTCVDSGTICITDPCYVTGNQYSDKEYDSLCDRMYSKDNNSNNHTSLFDNPTLGIVHHTRYGDGVYPIIATYDRDDMVVSIRIDFGSN